MQQARAQPFLQCLYVFAGSGLGNAEFARRTGETPYGRDPGEDRHAGQSIHVHHPIVSERPITIAVQFDQFIHQA
jgi:hypothetical protein